MLFFVAHDAPNAIWIIINVSIAQMGQDIYAVHREHDSVIFFTAFIQFISVGRGNKVIGGVINDGAGVFEMVALLNAVMADIFGFSREINVFGIHIAWHSNCVGPNIGFFVIVDFATGGGHRISSIY